ncbi:hypothetical protein ATANTOWER_031708 [Ataeniobius toweri]|uniref:Uncharacterized protein n=1 Tax=Ataeniobius toweri TaxID=208326 RepID=A0ABU7AUS2_9TELE|nr:hypothetical protein [Ataeniobius toweri]
MNLLFLKRMEEETVFLRTSVVQIFCKRSLMKYNASTNKIQYSNTTLRGSLLEVLARHLSSNSIIWLLQNNHSSSDAKPSWQTSSQPCILEIILTINVHFPITL